jgi:GT2 family glycosyltransferase
VRVTALLVSHDGARWLPAVLAGLADQQRRPDRVLAVDTGSSDDSVALLTESLGADPVRNVAGSFPDAVAAALGDIDTEWVWLLHDDANPDPAALGTLLDAAEQHSADIAGPKLREWPSLRRLLEVGITISATGRRETGLERGEYDQGQHDTIREVLAVNTAGMLVRTDVLRELDGFDRHLPLYGNDLDFGWRAALAGHRTIAVPDAIVFHAEAAHRGVRRTSQTGRRTRTHRHEREAALYTLLANTRGRAFPLQVVRLAVGTLLRVLGFLLARQPGHAGDELVALVNVMLRPAAVRRARRARSGLTAGDPERVRGLLAPWWLPYRHGLDLVSDFATAAANQGRDAAERRRLARAAESGPVPDEADELDADSGLLARLATSPLALGVVAVLLVTVWGAREALGPLAGGALSPAPAQAGDWWRLATEGWHEIGQGTDAPAPGYLLPFAFAATVLLGHPALVVSLVFLLAVPFAAWGAWRFLRVAAELAIGRDASPLALAWGALAYAAVPVASGAWGQGRFGVVASAALLPWLAHAATGLFDQLVDRRWRAAWRTGLLLTVVTSFTPSAWLVVAVVVALTLGVGLAVAGDLVRTRAVWAPLVVMVAVPPVLLLPGAIGVLGHDLTAIFLEAGRLAQTPGSLDLAAGRLGDPSAPVLLGLALVPPALAALTRPATRLPVTVAWLLVAVAAVLAALLSHVTISLPAGSARPGLAFLMVLVQGALVTAVVIAAHGLWSGFAGSAFGWRQPVAAVLAVLAVLVPVGGLGWWLVSGHDQLHRPGESEVPAYMRQAAEHGAGHGVLVLRGTAEDGMTWEVHRGDGVRLGDDEILALTGPDQALDGDVTAMISEPTPEAMTALAGHGIDYLILPTPADAQVAATLDAAPGLTQASAQDRTTRAWKLDTPADADAVSGSGPWWHPVLLVLQILGVLVVAVMCGPTRREQQP